MQLIADVRHVQPADDRAGRRAALMQVDHAQRVGPYVPGTAGVQRRDVGVVLGRPGRALAGDG
jgi:hypothetical protein